VSGADPLDADAARARDAVVEAGRIAMRFFRQKHERWEKSPGQVVTEADIAVDRFLHAELRRGHAAGDGWLSEETEDDRVRLERRRVWVVDPIDGTRSFAEGTPEFTISVALLVDGAPALGFVLNPATSEMFEASRGGGARLNGARLRASPAAGLRGATIVASRFESRRRDFARLIPAAQLTSIGSLAYKLALVAAGRFDGYISWRRTHDWDIAAAVLLLAEAGALATDAAGGPIRLNRPEPRHQGVLAAGPPLHRELLAATGPAHEAHLASRVARGLPV
jgi:myo-inositol-1(or 4)-monophosphatase